MSITMQPLPPEENLNTMFLDQEGAQKGEKAKAMAMLIVNEALNNCMDLGNEAIEVSATAIKLCAESGENLLALEKLETYPTPPKNNPDGTPSQPAIDAYNQEVEAVGKFKAAIQVTEATTRQDGQTLLANGSSAVSYIEQAARLRANVMHMINQSSQQILRAMAVRMKH